MVTEISAKERFRSETWNERLNYAGSPPREPRRAAGGDGAGQDTGVERKEDRREDLNPAAGMSSGWNA